MAVEVQRYRLTVEQFQQMEEAGIFPPEVRVELVDGEPIEMSPINPPHSHYVTRLSESASHLFRGRCSVRIQCGLDLDDHTELYPDLVLARLRPGLYLEHNPLPADALLVAEVSDTSLRYDTHVKALRYAQAGIAEYWIVNIRRKTLTVYRNPSSGEYKDTQILASDASIHPLAFPDVEIPIADILG